MDASKVEIAAVKDTVESATEEGLLELAEFQLALVGGGSGDVVIV